jgi:hypothetical protein
LLAILVRYDLVTHSGEPGTWIREMQSLTADRKPLLIGEVFGLMPTMTTTHWANSLRQSVALSGYGAPASGTIAEAAEALKVLDGLNTLTISLDSVLGDAR